MADTSAGPGIRRVLLTTDPVGGVWDYTLELARELGRINIATVLAVMGAPRSDAQRAASAAIPALTVEESAFKLEWMQDPDSDLIEAGRWLIGLEEKHRPDIVHLNNYAHVTLPWRAPRLLVAHSCVVSWWQTVKRMPLPPSLNGYAEMVATALHEADAVVAPSQSFLADLERIYGPLPSAHAIHNGRRAADFPPTAKEPFVMTAGRAWDEAKNIRAVDAVAADLPWPIYLAGDCRGPEGGGWEPRDLRCLGRLPTAELAHRLGRASIFVLPAYYEPFGLTVLEAALAGCALVLGDTATMRELWADAALFVPSDDRPALSAALRELIDDPEMLASFGAKAQERARRYEPARMTRAYLGIYGALAVGRHGVTGRADPVMSSHP